MPRLPRRIQLLHAPAFLYAPLLTLIPALPYALFSLEYWFGGDKAECMTRHWKGLKETDDEIREKFLPTWEALSAESSALAAEWATVRPRSVLALLIVWDQFSRALWRGDPRSFQNDGQSGKLSMATCLAGDHKPTEGLDDYSCHFFTMPLMHSEDVEVQRFNNETFPSKDAKGHMEVCERFGRFPKRNAALGRESTPEEIEYMASEEAQGRPY